MAMKVLIALSLCLMVSSVLGRGGVRRLSYRAQQCRINQLTSSQPNNRIESEGGFIELWDEREDQFQCSGIQAMRMTIQPYSLSIPNFHPYPTLIYIERGEGMIGITFPGCPETYESSSYWGQQGFQGREQGFQGKRQQGSHGKERKREWDQGDAHQKVHRFRRGDILAIPPGAVHWGYNDRDEDVVAFIVNDLNNQANQLDLDFRAFYLAGGLGGSQHQGMRPRARGHGQQQPLIQNILSPFETKFLAQALGVEEDLIRRMQESENRGLIVRVERGQMRIMTPKDEDEEYDRRMRRDMHMGLDVSDGLEETMCTARLRYNLDTRSEADVYSHQGGRLNIVNDQKLSILGLLDMSAEKVHMYPNTIFSPHWAMNSHSIIYVTRGEAQAQVVGSNGELVMDETVSEGDMFVVPQFFVSTCKAGRNGFEYVSFKTTSSPMKSPIVGYTSVFRAMPVQVIANAYQISPSEAQDLKFNREHQTFFLSPMGRSSSSS